MDAQDTKKDKGTEATLNHYKCGYCGFEFEQAVRKIAVSQGWAQKQRHMSSQVRCLHCGNFLRTWEDGKEVAEVLVKRGEARIQLVKGFPLKGGRNEKND